MGSHYWESVRNDPELAEQLADAPDTPVKEWRPRPAEWSLDAELMASQFDRLGEWLTQFANANRRAGSPPVKPPPRFPRPVTAVDKAKETARERRQNNVVDLVKEAQERHKRQQEGGG